METSRGFIRGGRKNGIGTPERQINVAVLPYPNRKEVEEMKRILPRSIALACLTAAIFGAEAQAQRFYYGSCTNGQCYRRSCPTGNCPTITSAPMLPSVEIIEQTKTPEPCEAAQAIEETATPEPCEAAQTIEAEIVDAPNCSPCGPTLTFTDTSEEYAPGVITTVAQRLLDAANRTRARFGLRPLLFDARLEAGARSQARYCASRGFLIHGASDEILAQNYSNGEAAINQWLASSGHRACLLNAGYTRAGFVAIKGRDGRVWCAMRFSR